MPMNYSNQNERIDAKNIVPGSYTVGCSREGSMMKVIFLREKLWRMCAQPRVGNVIQVLGVDPKYGVKINLDGDEGIISFDSASNLDLRAQ